MFLIKTGYLCFFIFLSLVSFGQSNDLDVKYTPPKNAFKREFAKSTNASNNNGSLNNQSNEFDLKNVFKLNVGMIPRGVLAVGLEHSFIDELSFCAEAGITFTNDIFQETFPDFYDNFSSQDPSAIELYSLLTKSNFVESKKPYLGGAIRVYTDAWNGDNANDVFIELGIRTYAYELDVKRVSSPVYTGYDQNGYYIDGDNRVLLRNLNFMLKYGAQFVFGQKVKNVHDLFVGVGYNLCSFNEFVVTETYTPTFGLELTYSQTGSRAIQGLPMLLIGYSIGFGR